MRTIGRGMTAEKRIGGVLAVGGAGPGPSPPALRETASQRTTGVSPVRLPEMGNSQGTLCEGEG